MSNITNLIANIRRAVYGKDVRESIAEAIEQTYEDASEHGNANMEVVQARGTFNTLNNRLNNSDNVKADKTQVTSISDNLDAEITNRQTAVANLQTQLNSVASGSPAGVYATVSDLTTADPDHSKIYVVSADGHWYYYGNSQWNDGGQYQAPEDSDTVNVLNNDLYKLIIEKPINDYITTSTNYSHIFNMTMDQNSIGTINFSIKNTAGTDGYATIKGLKNNEVVQTFYSGLVETGDLITNTVQLTSDIDQIEINNVNHKNNFIFNLGISYKEELIDTLNNQDVIINQLKYINKEENPQYEGYVKNDGTLIKQSGQTTNRYTVFEDVIKNSSFIYSGAYSGWGVVWGYYEDGTAVQLLGKGEYTDKIIQIQNSNIVKVIAWSDTDVKALSFHYYNTNIQFPRTIVVDANGDGYFSDIQSAIDFAKSNYDVATVPVTIFVKNGIYTVSPKATSPYFAINKGANKISIIGESKEHTIINCTCTDELQGIVLNIGGDCTIENLTINNFADASFTTETILEGNHRPYCIHNDAIIVGNTEQYKTTVKNCRLYSECYTPLGAGLHHLQTQQYIDTDFIYNSSIYNTEGSFYIHASYDNNAVPDGLEVIGCNIISLNGAPCIFTTNISGSVNMGQIPQTYQRNILYTNGNNELNMIGLGGITPYSKMNSNNTLNK